MRPGVARTGVAQAKGSDNSIRLVSSISLAPTSAAVATGMDDESAPAALQIGRELRNRYVLESCLGSGGMGTVYKALDRFRCDLPEGRRHVAIKILHAQIGSRPELLSNLRREFYCAQALSHRNIVQVYELDRDDDVSFFTMELLDGALLSDVIEQMRPRSIPRSYAWAIVRDVGAGLAHAHSRNVVHADLKPQNIMITQGGEVRVLDFGASSAPARPRSAAAPDQRNDFPAVTPAYASCELLDGQLADPRDDLYALACLSYELLTGEHPFQRRRSTEARELGLVPRRPPDLSQRQWQTLLMGLSWDREGRSLPVSDWLDRLQVDSVAAAHLPGTDEFKAASPSPRSKRLLGFLGALGLKRRMPLRLPMSSLQPMPSTQLMPSLPSMHLLRSIHSMSLMRVIGSMRVAVSLGVLLLAGIAVWASLHRSWPAGQSGQVAAPADVASTAVREEPAMPSRGSSRDGGVEGQSTPAEGRPTTPLQARVPENSATSMQRQPTEPAAPSPPGSSSPVQPQPLMQSQPLIQPLTQPQPQPLTQPLQQPFETQSPLQPQSPLWALAAATATAVPPSTGSQTPWQSPPASVTPPQPQSQPQSQSQPQRPLPGQPASPPQAQMAKNAAHESARAVPQKGKPEKISIAGNYRIRRGQNFAEIHVGRAGASDSDTGFVWWTEPSSAKPGVDYVPQTRAAQVLSKDRRFASLFVRLIPNVSRTQPAVFYVAVAESRGGSLSHITRTSILLPVSR